MVSVGTQRQQDRNGSDSHRMCSLATEADMKSLGTNN